MSSLLSISSLVPRMRAKPMECEWFVDAKNEPARGAACRRHDRCHCGGTSAHPIGSSTNNPTPLCTLYRFGEGAKGDGARANWRIQLASRLKTFVLSIS